MDKKLTNQDARIVLALLHGPLHARGLAGALGVSHATVLHAAGRLLDAGVLDAVREGKNRVFSLRRGLPARFAVLEAEAAKAGWLLATYPILDPILERALRAVRAPLVILFGSYAKFAAAPASDIDLFVETGSVAVQDRLAQLHRKLSPKIGQFSPTTPLGREIARNHVILRGIELFYERIRFFE